MIVEILTNIAWPIVVLIIGLVVIFVFKGPISKKINTMRGLEYLQSKDGKKRFRVAFLEPALTAAKENMDLPAKSREHLPHLADPKKTIIEAWSDLEKVAEEKLKELGINYKENGFKNTPLVYLQTQGIFSPKAEAAMQNLQILKDQVAHYPPEAIPENDANDYVRVKNEIKKTIEAVQGLPAVQLNAIVMIMRNLSCIIDAGKYNNITIDEIYRRIEDESILTFIAGLDGAHELKGILGSELYKGFDRFYTKSLLSIYYAYAGDHRRKWGIEKSGLCLVLAWTIEIIQMGSGWHPNENLSEL